MEADVVVAEAGMDKTGDDMLAGMLLHPGKALLPVKNAFYLRADLQGLPGVVPDFSIFLMCIEDLHVAQISRISGLSAAFRKKCGLVERHLPVILFLLTGSHHRRKCGQMAVFII